MLGLPATASIKARQRAMAKGSIARNHEDFKKSGSAIHAHYAIVDSIQNKLALPDWVLKYLLASSLEIARRTQSQVPREGEVNRTVARALRLDASGGNPFRES